MAKSALMVRHDAAIALVAKGELESALALSYVVWPRRGSRLEDGSVPTERQFYSEEFKAEIRERHAAGETLPDLARKTGVSFATVKSIAAREAEKRLAQQQARRLTQAQEEAGRLFA